MVYVFDGSCVPGIAGHSVPFNAPIFVLYGSIMGFRLLQYTLLILGIDGQVIGLEIFWLDYLYHHAGVYELVNQKVPKQGCFRTYT